MRYEFRLDYATINFVAGQMTPVQVGKILLGDEFLAWTRKGLSENAPLYSPLGLRWVGNNGYAEMPHKLEVVGAGCEHFALTLPALRAAAESRFSRLDFAFDVIMKRREWRKYISECFAASLESERKAKCFCLQGSGEAMTIYIGSRRCAKFFRIYNKSLQDEKYTYAVDGVEVPVGDDECVIRYEVELHRFKDSKNLYDPSPLFDWYYNKDKHAELGEYLKRLWLSFGNDVLLPPGFAECELYPRITTNTYFVQSKSEAECLSYVNEKLHEYPRTFERTLQYVVQKFGKYLPYIVDDDDYRSTCYKACRREFGFAPEVYVERVPESAFYEIYDDEDIGDYDPFAGDQLQFDEFVKGVAEIDC